MNPNGFTKSYRTINNKPLVNLPKNKIIRNKLICNKDELLLLIDFESFHLRILLHFLYYFNKNIINIKDNITDDLYLLEAYKNGELTIEEIKFYEENKKNNNE